MADLIEIKIGFLLIIYLFGLAGGILPWVMSKETSHDRFLAMGDTFAGGVLVGAGLIHLLSSGVEDFKLVVPNSNYPITYLLAGAGFFLILLLEGVIAKERSSDDAVNLPQPVTWGAQLGTILVSLSKGHAYAYVLLLVLSVHSIIEGLTLGAQQSFIGSLVVFIAIIAHKSLAGFALGVSFHRLGLVRSRAVPLIMFFAVMTPIGIIFGLSRVIFCPTTMPFCLKQSLTQLQQARSYILQHLILFAMNLIRPWIAGRNGCWRLLDLV